MAGVFALGSGMAKASAANPTELTFTAADGQTPLGIRLFRPQGTARATVVYAHGGGFSHGSRKDATAAKLAERLAGDGVAVASIDYRKATQPDAFAAAQRALIEHEQARTARVGLRINPNYCGAAFYAALEDFGAALAFLRSKAKTLKLGKRIVALGASAGGIAAASLAYPPRGPWQELERPDAAMGISAAMVQPWRLAADGPPLVMMHGCHDGVIAPHNIRVLAAKAEAKGAPVITHITEVRGHRPQVEAFLNGIDPDGRPYLDLLRALL
ncbi:MAG: alpha/beta hydrolase fold domain-containing protein [Paracoccaceae bacterium]